MLSTSFLLVAITFATVSPTHFRTLILIYVKFKSIYYFNSICSYIKILQEEEKFLYSYFNIKCYLESIAEEYPT